MLSNSARSLTVPVVTSIWLSTVRTLAVGELRAVGAVIGLRREGGAVMQALHELCHIVFGDGEDGGDGLQLGDHHEPVGIPRRDVVSLVHLAQADAAGDRRGDVAVDQVDFRGLDGRLVGGDGADVLIHQGTLRIDLLLRPPNPG